MPDPFISVGDLGDHIGKDLTNDPGAIQAVDAACDIVRDFTEQSINAGTASIALDGTGTDALLLPERPVTKAGTVIVNGGTITDFMLTGEGLLLRGTVGGDGSWCGGYSGFGGWRPCWPRGRQNVQVTYEYGYQPIDLPRSVRMVALSLASRLVIQGVAQSETVGDVQVNYGMAATDLTKTEQAILYGYKRARSF